MDAVTSESALDGAAMPVFAPGLDQITVFDSFAAARPSWINLEPRAVLTPYQRFDWMQAMHAQGLDRGRLAIAVLGPPEQPVALLPLSVEQRNGLRQAQLVGSSYGNSDWMIFAQGAAGRLTLPVLEALFAEITRQAGGIDIMRFSNLPAQWAAQANPLLAFRHQPAPNNLYAAEIGTVPTPFADHAISTKLRGNLRRGRVRLEQQFGPVAVRHVTDAAMLEQVHAAFLRQRGERFAQMGVDNIFATPAMVGLFQSLGAAGLGQTDAAFQVHALYGGDTILATSFGAVVNGHYSQYINSTSAGPASKYSLMATLMAPMMDDLIAAGITGFDMGTGDFAYKSDWTQPQTVFDAAIAVSRRGAMALPVLDGLVGAKRAIKQNPRAWALAKQAIRLRYRLKDALKRQP